MSISKIKVLNPDPILERSPLEYGAVARVAHVNNIVDQINEAFNFAVLGFNIVAIGGSTTPGLVGAGDLLSSGSISGGCRPGTQPYTYSNGTTGCINHILRTFFPVVTKPEVGVYTFTFPKAPPLGYDVLLSPPAVLNGSRISLVKTSETVFTITAKDAAGGSADGLLTGMYLEIKLYN